MNGATFSAGSVLIFVTRKANAEELATQLRARDFPCEEMELRKR